MIDQLSLFIREYQSLVYLIVFVAIVVEGDISLLLFGALSKEHVLKYFWVLPVAIIASVFHDFIFWKIGKRISRMGKKKYLFIDFEKMDCFLEKIQPSIGVYIILSKFAWNFNRIVIVSSGFIKTPFKKFIKFSGISAVLWAISFLSIGFVFADQTDIFRQNMLAAALLVSAVLVAMALFEIYLKKILRKYFFGNNGSESQNIPKDIE
jgi:membrane protein DedA with SNARE-associated domain